MRKRLLMLLVLCGILFSASVQAEPLNLLYVKSDDGIREVDLEKYLVGVVLAEMPPEFQLEALKAQAVAARTFVWHAILCGGKHDDCDVCTDASCCQGYLSEVPNERWRRVRDAVEATRGLILIYDNQPIEAAFFSCSGGYTEDAAEVWGTEYPYLTAKESPGEEIAFCYQDTANFSVEQLEDILDLSLQETPEPWFTDWEYTKGNGVASVRICGKYFTGISLRKILGLRSTAFSVDVMGTEVQFHTRGYGHRVGLSQYGAEALALGGKSFREVLDYYYEGTEIIDVSEFIARNSQ